jgi:LmbE family N-acetylglucosaminyl deacetylase
MMRALFVHAHFDDFEFTAAGTFALWQQARGESLHRRVLVCTDGCAGHHFRTRGETGRIRRAEQAASARIGKYEWQLLTLPDGQPPREACLEVNKNLLAGLWKAIRDFEPDYLFCPGLPSDPLAGVHIDHVAVADAVRKVSYMINVPHAFTPEFPADERESRPVKVPVIFNVWDPYTAGANSHDLAVDIEPVFKEVCEMSWCHQSQIMEWLPWVGRHALELPKSTQDWERVLRARFAKRNHDLGIQSDRPFEVFTVTGWGEIPRYDLLLEDFPQVSQEHSNLTRLDEKLRRFGCL